LILFFDFNLRPEIIKKDYCGPLIFLLYIYTSRREEVTALLRKLHNGELHNLYFSPDVTRVIKSGRMKCVGDIAYTEERK
jgi:hypothetical protein